MFSSQNPLRTSTAGSAPAACAAPEYPYVSCVDLNEQFVHNKPDTFYLRVNTACMLDAGIQAGDILIVDRSLEPENGKVIIALLDGELLVRYYEKRSGRQRLVPATSGLSPIDVDASAQFLVWGVVTYRIRNCG